MKFILVLFLLISLGCFQYSFCQNRLLQTVYFEKNSYKVNKKYLPILKEFARIGSSDSCSLIRIFGFADTTGSDEYNDDISMKRAYAVYKILLSDAKIDTTKFRIKWNGDSEEFYDLHFKEAHIQQRCVDISIAFKE